MINCCICKEEASHILVDSSHNIIYVKSHGLEIPEAYCKLHANCEDDFDAETYICDFDSEISVQDDVGETIPLTAIHSVNIKCGISS